MRSRRRVALRSSGLVTRVGLSTGEVVTGDPLVAGAPVDEAARLQERAGAGDVIASARTWRTVRHAVEATPREDSWAVDTVDPHAAPLVRRLETPLVGREQELREITREFESAVGAGVPRLVTVFGAPGLGKSRLAVECVERLQGVANVAVTHCRADGRDATYEPLRGLLTELADGEPAAWLRRRLGTDDAPHLADQLAVAVGLETGTAHAEDAALATRRLLAGLARKRPLLLVLEDVHWAAPAFLDLVESLVELAHAPILVLCLARPDLLDLRPQWGGGRVRSSTILLDALPAAESETLLDLLSSDRRLDAAARNRILEIAEGNPLFIEQLLAAALEGELGTLPDSIQMLLAARLDRLDEADRAVVQAAAVCGTSFTTAEVSALVEGDVAASLVTLVRRELIRPDEAEDTGRGGWSFRHALVRDAAYAGVPKWRRAELHERLAERALEAGTDGDASAAHHLDLALRARLESGERGSAIDRLAERAAEHLRRAGLAAVDRDDWFAAASLLARACELLPRDARERVELLPKLGEALTWRGERATAREVFAEAHAVASELGDARLAARARLATLLALMWGEAPVPPERMLRDVEDAVPVLEHAGDHGALAMAEIVRFHALDRSGLPSSEQRLSLALDHARKAGEWEIEHRVMSWICITLPGGGSPGGRGDRPGPRDRRDVPLGLRLRVCTRRARAPAGDAGRVRGGARARGGDATDARGARPVAVGRRPLDRDRRGRADGRRRRGCRAGAPERASRSSPRPTTSTRRLTSRGGWGSCSRGKGETTRRNASRASRSASRPRACGWTSGGGSSSPSPRRTAATRLSRCDMSRRRVPASPP